MSYDTKFTGTLFFKEELTMPQLKLLKTFLGEDCRPHPEWQHTSYGNFNFIDLEFTDDYSGLKWNGTEKTYNLHCAINLILTRMRMTAFPEFELLGKLVGRDDEDEFEVYIGDDKLAHVRYGINIFKTITCPHCAKEFEVTEEE